MAKQQNEVAALDEDQTYRERYMRWKRAWRSPYELWKTSEGLPTLRGLSVNVNEVELTPWASRGGSGVFVNLDGTGGFNDGYVCEIPPGGSLNPVRHIYDETIFIVSGRGATSVWVDGKPKQTFEWGERSLFAIPPNAWFQMHNGLGTESSRYFAITSAPRIIDSLKDLDFIFDNPWVFSSRFNGEPGYFQQADAAESGRMWRTNFIADVISATTIASSADRRTGLRGIGTTGAHFEMVNATVKSHTSSWPVGTYKGAHRHGPGIHVTILLGEGYTLMWKDGEPVQRVDWKPGTVLVPPEMWFHQHFNTAAEPTMFLAIGWGSDKAKTDGTAWGAGGSVNEGGDTIEYELEDPRLHLEYHEALAKSGVTCQMGPFHPHCTER